MAEFQVVSDFKALGDQPAGYREADARVAGRVQAPNLAGCHGHWKDFCDGEGD